MKHIYFWLVVVAFTATACREIPGRTSPITEPPPGDESVMAILWHLRSLVDVATPDGKPQMPMDALTNAIFESAKKAVDIALKVRRGMTLFLGLMKVVEDGGGMRMHREADPAADGDDVPERPAEPPRDGRDDPEPVGERARSRQRRTPFGIRAMQELNKLNPHKAPPRTRWRCSWRSTPPASRCWRPAWSSSAASSARPRRPT